MKQWVESAEPLPRRVAVAWMAVARGVPAAHLLALDIGNLFFSTSFRMTNLEQCFALTTFVFRTPI